MYCPEEPSSFWDCGELIIIIIIIVVVVVVFVVIVIIIIIIIIIVIIIMCCLVTLTGHIQTQRRIRVIVDERPRVTA